ncbi:MAG: amidohydrolase [Eubacteriales bacterium]|nr:amidohydrolase [Eubacteriales bacterium]
MKQPAVLFKNIQIVTPMPGGPVLSLTNAFVAVAAGEIRYVGQFEDTAVQILKDCGFAEYESYDGRRKILWPTMANTHGHIPMTLMRNQADDAVLHTWLFEMIFPREKYLTPDHVLNGTRLGMAEMIRSGTGTAADMYYYSESVVEAALESGMRLNVCFDGKATGSDGKTHLVRPSLEKFIADCQTYGQGRINPALLVHSLYLYEPDLHRELSETAQALNCFVQVHIAETKREVEESLAKYGKRPASMLAELGYFKSPTIAAHCVHLDDAEREILKAHSVFVAHNPTSNLKLGSGIADVAAMLRAGLRVGLGTDGAASNNNLNLYQEMRLASLLAKGTSGDAALLPADALIEMATLHGQKGLGFERSGCIAVGYEADLQILNADQPAMWPLGEPTSALVYSADAAFVESLMVAGQWLLYKNDLQTLDEEKIKADALRSSARLNP